jgi:hypothetical protein
MDHGRRLASVRAIDAAGRPPRAARRIASDVKNTTVLFGALFRCRRAAGPPPARSGNLIL